jgi:hypothetical protein
LEIDESASFRGLLEIDRKGSKARQGKARQGKARQGKARQGKGALLTNRQIQACFGGGASFKW